MSFVALTLLSGIYILGKMIPGYYQMKEDVEVKGNVRRISIKLITISF